MKDIKLICFDLGGNLIEGNMWRTLNLAMGMSAEKDDEMFNQYWSGSLQYDEWINKILEFYKQSGQADKNKIIEVLSGYQLKDGAEDIISYLKDKGYQVAINSGSMDIGVEIVAKDLGVTSWRANSQFIFNENNLLSDIVVLGDEPEAQLKNLEEIFDELNIDPEECVCFGNDPTDVPMFKKTGRGITFVGSGLEKDAWQVIENLADLKDIL